MPNSRMIMMAAGLMLATPAFAQESVEGLAVLGWMEGAWATEDGGRWTEEHWTDARGGVMLGTARSGEGPRATSFEFMRIAADGEGVISFWGSPGGKPAVAFRLVVSKASEAAFENPAHDFPTRIEYRRSGDEMVATVSGPGGAGAMSWRFRRAE